MLAFDEGLRIANFKISPKFVPDYMVRRTRVQPIEPAQLGEQRLLSNMAMEGVLWPQANHPSFIFQQPFRACGLFGIGAICQQPSLYFSGAAF